MLGLAPLSGAPLSALLTSDVSYTLTCSAGSYTLAGANAALTKSRLLTASAGAYAVSGKDATVLLGRLAIAQAGSYAYSGKNADALLTRLLTAEAGSYAFAGADADLQKAASAAPGPFNEGGHYEINDPRHPYWRKRIEVEPEPEVAPPLKRKPTVTRIKRDVTRDATPDKLVSALASVAANVHAESKESVVAAPAPVDEWHRADEHHMLEGFLLSEFID